MHSFKDLKIGTKLIAKAVRMGAEYSFGVVEEISNIGAVINWEFNDNPIYFKDNQFDYHFNLGYLHIVES